MENGDLLQEEQGEDGVEGLQDLLLFGACEVAGDGAKKDLRDQEADFFSFRHKGDLEVE